MTKISALSAASAPTVDDVFPVCKGDYTVKQTLGNVVNWATAQAGSLIDRYHLIDPSKYSVSPSGRVIYMSDFSDMAVGAPIRWTQSTDAYYRYGIVDYVAFDCFTYRGFNNQGTITSLWVGNPELVSQHVFYCPGACSQSGYVCPNKWTWSGRESAMVACSVKLANWTSGAPALPYTPIDPAPANYTTGTVKVAAGVVTLTGGTFPAWAADSALKWMISDWNGASGFYTVKTRDSDHQLTLDDATATTSGVSKTYGLAYVVPYSAAGGCTPHGNWSHSDFIADNFVFPGSNILPTYLYNIPGYSLPYYPPAVYYSVTGISANPTNVYIALPFENPATVKYKFWWNPASRWYTDLWTTNYYTGSDYTICGTFVPFS